MKNEILPRDIVVDPRGYICVVLDVDHVESHGLVDVLTASFDDDPRTIEFGPMVVDAFRKCIRITEAEFRRNFPNTIRDHDLNWVGSW